MASESNKSRKGTIRTTRYASDNRELIAAQKDLKIADSKKMKLCAGQAPIDKKNNEMQNEAPELREGAESSHNVRQMSDDKSKCQVDNSELHDTKERIFEAKRSRDSDISFVRCKTDRPSKRMISSLQGAVNRSLSQRNELLAPQIRQEILKIELKIQELVPERDKLSSKLQEEIKKLKNRPKSAGSKNTAPGLEESEDISTLESEITKLRLEKKRVQRKIDTFKLSIKRKQTSLGWILKQNSLEEQKNNEMQNEAPELQEGAESSHNVRQISDDQSKCQVDNSELHDTKECIFEAKKRRNNDVSSARYAHRELDEAIISDLQRKLDILISKREQLNVARIQQKILNLESQKEELVLEKKILSNKLKQEIKKLNNRLKSAGSKNTAPGLEESEDISTLESEITKLRLEKKRVQRKIDTFKLSIKRKQTSLGLMLKQDPSEKQKNDEMQNEVRAASVIDRRVTRKPKNDKRKEYRNDLAQLNQEGVVDKSDAPKKRFQKDVKGYDAEMHDAIYGIEQCDYAQGRHQVGDYLFYPERRHNEGNQYPDQTLFSVVPSELNSYLAEGHKGALELKEKFSFNAKSILGLESSQEMNLPSPG